MPSCYFSLSDTFNEQCTCSCSGSVSAHFQVVAPACATRIRIKDKGCQWEHFSRDWSIKMMFVCRERIAQFELIKFVLIVIRFPQSGQETEMINSWLNCTCHFYIGHKTISSIYRLPNTSVYNDRELFPLHDLTLFRTFWAELMEDFCRTAVTVYWTTMQSRIQNL